MGVWVVQGEAAKLLLRTKDGREYWAWVDRGDLPIVEPYRWSAKVSGRRVYAQTNVRLSDGAFQTASMHRLLLPEARSDIDHINHDGLDNRRGNLRPATRSQNIANTPLTADNTSGYKGVTAGTSAWVVSIRLNNRAIYLGSYQDIVEAALAYDRAARKYFGEFALTNYPEFAAGTGAVKRPSRKNNGSGYIGVRPVVLEGVAKAWTAEIRVANKTIGLGRFRDIIEAALAFDRAARKYRGPDAKTNYPAFAAGPDVN